MQTNIFPSAYFHEISTCSNEKINEAKKRSANKISSIQDSRQKNQKHHAYDFTFAAAFFWGFSMNPILLKYKTANKFLIENRFLLFILPIIIFIVITFLLYKSTKNKEKKSQEYIESSISLEKDSLNNEINEIRENANRDYYQYVNAFEEKAKELSVSFAESELVKEVAEWITNGFCKLIDAADRRSHIENISVPFEFKVYETKITCNLGDYDFELNRCRNLSSPLEQTALARAIASTIELYIIIKYPKDSSGTDFSINIDFRYYDEYPKTTITYIATNGNYESLRNW